MGTELLSDITLYKHFVSSKSKWKEQFLKFVCSMQVVKLTDFDIPNLSGNKKRCWADKIFFLCIKKGRKVILARRKISFYNLKIIYVVLSRLFE